MTNNTYITFGNMNEYALIPTIEIVMVKGEEETVIGHLTPFRDYRFQISETVKGELDLGSTPVVPEMSAKLRAIGNTDIAYNYVAGQIQWAMINYSNCRYAMEETDGEPIAILPRLVDKRKLHNVTTTILKWMGIQEEA